MARLNDDVPKIKSARKGQTPAKFKAATEIAACFSGSRSIYIASGVGATVVVMIILAGLT